ncbi:MAG: DUF721 domain-containing protein [bacterium]
MFKHISELLSSFVTPKDEWKIKLFNNWDKVIGKLKDKVVILKIENKLLVLGVTHPAWSQELFMLSDILKNRINSLFEKEHIKYIRFETVKIKKKEYKSLKSEKLHLNDEKIIKNLSLTKNEYVSLTKIKNEELKESIKKFCLRCKEGH